MPQSQPATATVFNTYGHIYMYMAHGSSFPGETDHVMAMAVVGGVVVVMCGCGVNQQGVVGVGGDG